MMKFIRSFTNKKPVCFSLALCLVAVVMSVWLIYVSTRIADDMKGNGMGKCGAEGVAFDKKVKLGLVLVALNGLCSITYALGFTYWSIKLRRKEMVAQAALIKQKEATEEAERKSMSKSIAVANASHEVRTALAGITGLIQMCRAEIVPRSALDQNLKHMESCTNDLYSLLNSILDASKIEAGKMAVEEDEFDMQELVEDVVDLYYPVGMKKGVDVILDQCDGSVEKFRKVRGDRGKLKQVLSNLLYNAIKFTDEGYVSLRAWARNNNNNNNNNAAGEIQVDIQKEKEGSRVMEYIFDVVDTGKGIPKEKRKSVFENYVQVIDDDDDSNNAAAQHHKLGHGLGLAIVKSLVRLLGGEISIVDKEIGEKGTCFRFNTFLETYTSGSDDDESNHQEIRDCWKLIKPRVVLFLQCEERSKIAKRFLEGHGVKVNVVNKGYQQLNKTLKKLKQKLFPLAESSLLSSSSSASSPASRSKEVPLSALDGRDDKEERKHMVLIIIDTSVGPFPQVSRAVAEFLKLQQQQDYGWAKVVWIHTLPLPTQTLNLPSTDLLMFKPLQGSRLHYVLGLLLNFGAASSSSWEDGREVEVVIEKEEEEIIVEEKLVSESSREKKKKGAILDGKRMLIVEDNMVLRITSSRVVSQLGAIAYTCNNGEEAVNMVTKALREHSQSPFDYILMDCEMAIMDGFEATKRIKEQGKAMGIYIPIIALTAHTENEEIEKKISEAGMDHYLQKPLQQTDLLTAIHHLAAGTTLAT